MAFVLIGKYRLSIEKTTSHCKRANARFSRKSHLKWCHAKIFFALKLNGKQSAEIRVCACHIAKEKAAFWSKPFHWTQGKRYPHTTWFLSVRSTPHGAKSRTFFFLLDLINFDPRVLEEEILPLNESEFYRSVWTEVWGLTCWRTVCQCCIPIYR